MRFKLLLVLFVCFMIVPSRAYSMPSDNELRAFSDSRDWKVVMQYWRDVFGQSVSRIDQQSYFFSPYGKHNPYRELKAFLDALFNASDISEIACKNPARFRVVDEHFLLTKSGKIKPPNCERLKKWKESLGKRSLSVIFPAAYLNNPASMYGHTFLRFNTKEGSEDALLAYGASFGANTGEDGGFAFALKGLLGGYLATFSLEPYYDLTKRYGDIEHRDIWEYELMFSEEEVDRALDFVWEVGNSYVDYFFFDENCSLYVLAALEFARPSLQLIDKFGIYVIPTDTLKLLFKQNNLIKKVNFRPSLTSRLEDEVRDLSSKEIRLGKDIAAGKEKVEGKDLSASVVEFSYDYLEYLSSSDKIESNLARKLSLDILKLRSGLPSREEPKEDLSIDPPHVAHSSGRFMLGVGGRDNTFFSDYSFRPAYHDSLDPNRGLIKGQSIQFFDLRFRHYENDNFKLVSFTPISIESFAPVERVFSPISWNLIVGTDRLMVPKDGNNNSIGSFVGNAQGGVGKSYHLGDFSLSALVNLKAFLSESFIDDIASVGLGPLIRTNYRVTDSFRLSTSMQSYRMGIGERFWFTDLNAGAQVDLSKDLFLRFTVSHVESFKKDFNEALISFGAYF